MYQTLDLDRTYIFFITLVAKNTVISQLKNNY